MPATVIETKINLGPVMTHTFLVAIVLVCCSQAEAGNIYHDLKAQVQSHQYSRAALTSKTQADKLLHPDQQRYHGV